MLSTDPLEWNDTLLTGVAEIDRQHRILVDTLIEARTKLTGVPADTLFEQITRDLLAYAIYHFNTEEQLMQQYGYAAAAPAEAEFHLAEHRRFSQEVVALRTEARLGKTGAKAALLSFLEGWLVNHIMTVDKRLGQFIRSAPPNPTTVTELPRHGE
jgi:hemerythrin-like metal-binding protein